MYVSCKDKVPATGETWMCVSVTQCQLLESGLWKVVRPIVPATGMTVGVSAPIAGGTCVFASGIGASY